MCGICGYSYADPARPVERSLLQRMNDAMYHRGPDSEGLYVHDNVGIAMRRLAIIDLVTGNQPLANEDHTVWIVFNGEIYNYPELRPQLEARGHVFRTNSDTEAIVHLYEEYGTGCLQHLRGMFAFAIWDARQRRLFLARDRLGQKPLYYSRFDSALLFGSELKCLLNYPGMPREIDLEALHHYLSLQYIPDPWTAFKGIHKLPPAHYLLWHDGQVQIRRYWDLAYVPQSQLSLEEATCRLREVVTEAVRIRLLSDVPLGAHLSGGIDSSIIVGLMAELTDQPVKTFAIGFNETHFNETPYARQVAQQFGTDHYEFVLEPDALDVLPKMMGHFDEPFADLAAMPTWYLARMTRQHVTVALNGDGGDEAFAGYRRYYGDQVANAYRMVPDLLRDGVLRQLLQRLPVQTNRPRATSLVEGLRQLTHAASMTHAASKVRWDEYFSEAEKWNLYQDDVRQAMIGLPTAALLEEVFGQAQASNRLDRTLYTDMHTYLPGALLPKVDRMTMAHALEARSPFLDHKVMELTASFPAAWKVRGRQTKWILRKTFADLLPPAVEKRGKVGFMVPFGAWLRGTLYEPVYDLLLGPDAHLTHLLRREAVEQTVQAHMNGQADNASRVWALLSLETWLRQIQSTER